MSEDRDDQTVVITATTALPTGQTPVRARASVVVVAGNGIGQVFALEKQLTVGRGRDVDVRIQDIGISRRHAHLSLDDGKAVVEDLESTNGTFVNGVRIEGPWSLTAGDKLQFGTSTILRFEYQDETDAAFQRRMFDSASRDALTGAFNKGYFLERLGDEVRYALSHSSALSLILFDVDHFKQINDTRGHLAGDVVLRDLAKVAASVLRAEDVFARHGGEEFAALLRFTGVDDAAELAERLRHSVEQCSFEFEDVPISVTVSAGVAALAPGASSGPESLLAAADEALYRAKRNGRNRVERHGPA